MKPAHRLPPVIGCRGHDHEPDTSTSQTSVVDRVRPFRQLHARSVQMQTAHTRLQKAMAGSMISCDELRRAFPISKPTRP